MGVPITTYNAICKIAVFSRNMPLYSSDLRTYIHTFTALSTATNTINWIAKMSALQPPDSKLQYPNLELLY